MLEKKDAVIKGKRGVNVSFVGHPNNNDCGTIIRHQQTLDLTINYLKDQGIPGVIAQGALALVDEQRGAEAIEGGVKQALEKATISHLYLSTDSNQPYLYSPKINFTEAQGERKVVTVKIKNGEFEAIQGDHLSENQSSTQPVRFNGSCETAKAVGEERIDSLYTQTNVPIHLRNTITNSLASSQLYTIIVMTFVKKVEEDLPTIRTRGIGGNTRSITLTGTQRVHASEHYSDGSTAGDQFELQSTNAFLIIPQVITRDVPIPVDQAQVEVLRLKAELEKNTIAQEAPDLSGIVKELDKVLRLEQPGSFAQGVVESRQWSKDKKLSFLQNLGIETVSFQDFSISETRGIITIKSTNSGIIDKISVVLSTNNMNCDKTTGSIKISSPDTVNTLNSICGNSIEHYT